MDFKAFISEEKDKGVVFAFGRFNPPTSGHEKLINTIKKEAKTKGYNHNVVLSHSNDAKKNPLPAAKKLVHANAFFPKTNLSVSSKEAPTFFHHLTRLHREGHKNLVMVAGSDRIEDYKEKLQKWNGKEGPHGYFHFKNWEVKSSGDRDPDSEGTEGMSASKMRKHAEDNNFKEFKKGVPSHASEEHTKALFNDVRRGMSVKESRDIRERYIDGEIFNLGETVETNTGMLGEIVYRGSSYVTLELTNNTTAKYWIKDIQETNKKNTRTPLAKESFTPVTFNERFSSKKIPVLLMSKRQIDEMRNAHKQLTYNEYTTQHMDMCPSAANQLSELIKTNDKNPKYILQAIMAFDEMFGIEKEAVSKGFADQEMVHQFLIKFGIAHDTMNMLGYPDAQIMYMQGHLATMSKLSLHKDNTFANEFGTHAPTFSGSGEIEEDVDTSDYKVSQTVTSGGKVISRKIRSHKIKTDKEQAMAEQKANLRSFRQMVEDKKKLMAAKDDPCWDGYKMLGTKNKGGKQVPNCIPEEAVQEDTERDINRTPEKEIFIGVDKTIDDQGHPNKPLGLVSFKGYIKPSEGMLKKDEDEAHAAQVQNLSHHSSSYKMMKKAHEMDM
jgi:hypothetical protein